MCGNPKHQQNRRKDRIHSAELLSEGLFVDELVDFVGLEMDLIFLCTETGDSRYVKSNLRKRFQIELKQV